MKKPGFLKKPGFWGVAIVARPRYTHAIVNIEEHT